MLAVSELMIWQCSAPVLLGKETASEPHDSTIQTLNSEACAAVVDILGRLATTIKCASIRLGIEEL